MTIDTARYNEALAYAAALHRDQRRKGSEIPYISHLMSVSALVMEYGGDGDQAVAGLLHDSMEDQAEANGGAEALGSAIKARFGAEVLRLVLACTDAVTTPKPPWRERKEAYLAHLRHVDNRVALVSCADKLHNARVIVADLRTQGTAVFDRFSSPKAQTLWYYRSLADVFAASHPGPLADELALTVARIRAEARIDN